MLDWKFRTNAFTIAAAASISQVILVLSLPVLTRLYSAEGFGVFAVFTAIFSIIAGCSTFKYDAAIILPPPQDNIVARNLTILSIILSVVTSIVLVGLFAALLWLGYVASSLLVFLAYGLPLIATIAALQQWDARRRRYTRYSLGQILSAVINVSAGIALSVTGFHEPYGLVIGYLAGLTLAAMVASWGRVFTSFRPLPRSSELVKIANTFRQFPTYVLPTSIVLTAGTALIPVLVALQFGVAAAGIYAIANRFLGLPASTIGGALNESFRSTFSERSREGGAVTKAFIEMLYLMSISGVFLFGVIFYATPPLFKIFLGQEFQKSAELAGILVLGAFSQFVASPFNFVFHALSRARLGLIIQTICAICPIGILMGSSHYLEIELSLLYTSVATAVCSLLVVGTSCWVCVQHDRSIP